MMKEDKDEVGYGEGHVHHHCGPVFHDDKFYCRFFIPSSNRVGTCEKVSGAILPENGCELYVRIKS
jgi:hypothetical protein